MSLADYLAKNYLTADTKPEKKSKKRKRKDATEQATEGLVIADDDALGWDQNASALAAEDDGPLTGKYGCSSTCTIPCARAQRIDGA